MAMRISSLAVVAGFMLMFVIAAGIGILILVRLVQDHVYANKYRELLRLHAEGPSKAPLLGPQWRVVYKDNGRQRSLTFPAVDEAEAMRVVLQRGIEPRSIITLEPSA